MLYMFESPTHVAAWPAKICPKLILFSKHKIDIQIDIQISPQNKLWTHIPYNRLLLLYLFILDPHLIQLVITSLGWIFAEWGIGIYM